jgi:hypothetical protein
MSQQDAPAADPNDGMSALYISYRRNIEHKAAGKRSGFKATYEALSPEEKNSSKGRTLWRLFQLWNRIALATKEPIGTPRESICPICGDRVKSNGMDQHRRAKHKEAP